MPTTREYAETALAKAKKDGDTSDDVKVMRPNDMAKLVSREEGDWWHWRAIQSKVVNALKADEKAVALEMERSTLETAITGIVGHAMTEIWVDKEGLLRIKRVTDPNPDTSISEDG